MATIEKLQILQFRNLNNQYLEPNTNTNLFVGGNGHGKTNLIEALYYLGHNRSFKSKKIKDVVPFEKGFLQIDAAVDGVHVDLEACDAVHLFLWFVSVCVCVLFTYVKCLP